MWALTGKLARMAHGTKRSPHPGARSELSWLTKYAVWTRRLSSFWPGPLGFTLIGLVVLSLACATSSQPDPSSNGVEVIDLSPDTPKTWSARHLTAPVLAVFRGPNYVYAPRRVEIETTPAGGYLDLFYVRSGFQKRFEQGEAPAIVQLPSRVEAGPRDVLTIRAFAEGYQPKSVTFKLSEDFDRVAIDLEPLPNSLEAVSHRYFAGRSSVRFVTSEALTFRVQEADDGYAIILNETAYTQAAQASMGLIESSLIAESYGQQLGQDLMVQFVLEQSAQDGPVELRSRQRYDGLRDLHELVIDFVPSSDSGASAERALRALDAIGPGDISGCAMIFDTALRSELEAGELARALRPQGEVTDRYHRAAMRKLSEISVDGVIDFTDGSRLRTADAIELEMAIANASMAEGYLVLLRSFVIGLESHASSQQAAFKSLVAPEISPQDFDAIWRRAHEAERVCLAAR
ncbi:MAG: hypothetical protein CBC48_02975 [bacterium TMED88]|nr:hypothetical protein [Deltaproteobacteria bacterium]OUV35893.1 MAG: hypothetical protein CBC48_02975 [bacterium TMED88]